MVIKFKKYIKIIFLCNVLTLSAIIYGCSPTNILASGGGTALVVAEGERSLGAVVDDTTIKVNIAAKFINAGNNLFVNINTSILEGRVLLTGLVDNQEIRIEAVQYGSFREAIELLASNQISTNYFGEVYSLTNFILHFDECEDKKIFCMPNK